MNDDWPDGGRKPGALRRGGDPPGDGGDGRREVDAKGCPVTALGHDGAGHYWFFAPSGSAREIHYRQLYRREGLEDLFEGRLTWLYDNFKPREGALDVFRAGRWLLMACVDKGIFDNSMQRRGPGVWRDGAEIIVHAGDQVLMDGKWRRAGFCHGDYLYQLTTPAAMPAVKPATRAEGQQLLDYIKLWNWEDECGPDIILGGVGLAHLGAAPDWRSHLFVRAPYGSGKTWMAELFASAACARAPANNITPAHIYQGLTGEARAIVIDEAEADTGDGRITEILKLIRLMSGRKGGNIGRGSAEGKSRAYQITGMAYLTAISHPDLLPQDASRFIVLRLKLLATGPAAIGQHDLALAALAGAEAMGPALRARAIMAWPRFLDTVAVYRAAAMRENVEPRSADTMAALLAGRDLLLQDEVPGQSEAEGEIDKFDHLLIRESDRAEDGEGEQCVTHILSSQVETWGGGERKTIGEKIIDAQAIRGDRKAINEILGRCGLRLVFVREEGQVKLQALLVARRHVGLDRIFHGTRWAGAVWMQALEDIEGAGTLGPTHFGGAKSTRCSAIPVRLLPALKSEDDMEDRPRGDPLDEIDKD